jgi:Zn-dependent protease
MVVSLVILTAHFGFVFGAGLLALIAVHESGHMLFARREGVPVSAPIFLGLFGAFVRIKAPPRDARQEAVIAIGGPVVGTAGAAVCYALASALPAGHARHLLLGLAYAGFFLNLFNLVPVVPLDGGRVASALSVWANVAGLGIMVALLAGAAGAHLRPNPFLVIITVLGAITTVGRFRTARRNPGYLVVPAGTRTRIGLAYGSMLAVTALGMTVSHSALVDARVVDVNDGSAYRTVVDRDVRTLGNGWRGIDVACGGGNLLTPSCRDALTVMRDSATGFLGDLQGVSAPFGSGDDDSRLRSALAEYEVGLTALVHAVDNRDQGELDAALSRLQDGDAQIAAIRTTIDSSI